MNTQLLVGHFLLAGLVMIGLYSALWIFKSGSNENFFRQIASAMVLFCLTVGSLCVGITILESVLVSLAFLSTILMKALQWGIEAFYLSLEWIWQEINHRSW